MKAPKQALRALRAPPDLHHAARHLIGLMQLLGGWPVTRTGGWFIASPWSGRSRLWSYLLALLQAVLIAACLSGTVPLLLAATDTFLEHVILVLHLLYETEPLSILIIHWHTGTALAQYFNHWIQLQSSWVAVTVSSLRPRCERSSRRAASIILVFSVISPVYHMRVSPHLYVWKLPLYMCVVMQTLTEATLWRALNGEVAATATEMRARFHRTLVTVSLTPDAVRGYCMLWLRLRALTHALGDAWGFVLLHSLVLMIFMSMTSWFGLLSAVRLGLLRRVASTLTTIMCSTLIVNWVCSLGEHAARSVSREMLLELLTVPLRKLDTETAIEVMRFLQVIQFKPVSLKLKGFVVLQRKLCVSIAATVCTYIVVLAQLALTLSAVVDDSH